MDRSFAKINSTGSAIRTINIPASTAPHLEASTPIGSSALEVVQELAHNATNANPVTLSAGIAKSDDAYPPRMGTGTVTQHVPMDATATNIAPEYKPLAAMIARLGVPSSAAAPR